MNPAILGVIFHWLGGLASGSFYVPYKGVKKWSWETYWLVGGFFSWIICPWVLALLLTKDVVAVIGVQPMSVLWWTYFFGAMWGLGGLTFGLTMRYLGMSLGMGVALGYCTVIGTLMPPIFKIFMTTIPVDKNLIEIAMSVPGQITLAGLGVCVLGIVIAALAGLTKEREMPEEEKKKTIAEFSFKKGILVATFSGVMSACFNFALTAGNPIAETTIKHGTDDLWAGLPRLIVVLLGGFTTNFIWCVFLNIKNRSGREYINPVKTIVADAKSITERVPMLPNYIFSAMAGTCWYFQFFFYTMGERKMNTAHFGFASWTLHMASIIIFSTMWGFFFHEWKGASNKARVLIKAGIATLVLSTVVIGGGTYYQAHLDDLAKAASTSAPAAPAK